MASYLLLGYTASVQGRNIPLPEPIRQTNPWASPPPTQAGSKISDAEFWLSTTAKAVSSTPPPTQTTHPSVNGATPLPPTGPSGDPALVGQNITPQSAIAHRAPHLSHLRSHSIDTADMWGTSPSRPPTLRELQQRGSPMAQFHSQQNGNSPAAPQNTSVGATPQGWTTFDNKPAPVQPVDPFEAAWAAKAPTQSTNPFQNSAGGDGSSVVKKEFTVNL